MTPKERKKRRIPDHLYPAFVVYVKATQAGVVMVGNGAGGRTIADAARRVRVIDVNRDTEVAHIAWAAAGPTAHR